MTQAIQGPWPYTKCQSRHPIQPDVTADLKPTRQVHHELSAAASVNSPSKLLSAAPRDDYSSAFQRGAGPECLKVVSPTLWVESTDLKENGGFSTAPGLRGFWKGQRGRKGGGRQEERAPHSEPPPMRPPPKEATRGALKTARRCEDAPPSPGLGPSLPSPKCRSSSPRAGPTAAHPLRGQVLAAAPGSRSPRRPSTPRGPHAGEGRRGPARGAHGAQLSPPGPATPSAPRAPAPRPLPGAAGRPARPPR